MFRKIIASQLIFVLAVVLLVIPSTGCDKSYLKIAQEVAAGAVDIESTLSSLLPANDPRRPLLHEWRNRALELEGSLKNWDGQNSAPIIVNLGIVVEGFRTLVLPELDSSPVIRLAASLTDGALRLLTRRFQRIADEQAQKNGAIAAAALTDARVRESVQQCEEYLKTPPVKKPD